MTETTDDNTRGPDVSTKPYLLRAIYQWAVDSSFTPQILVSAIVPGVVVPSEYVKENQIVFNIHPESIKGLDLGDDVIWFSARFSGKACEVIIPIDAVVAIYARENGQGIVFQADGSGITPPSPPSNKSADQEKRVTQKKSSDKAEASHLKLVK